MKTLRFLAVLSGALLGVAPVFAGTPLPVTTPNNCYQTGNAINRMKDNIREANDRQDTKDAVDKAGKAAESAQGAIDTAQKASDLFDAYKALSDKDSEYDPNYNPPGAPQVPSDCPEGGQACFAAAYEKLNRTRANLERLRAVRGVTEDFYKASVSFGDDVSGVHGVAGLAWQAERRKIEQSFKGFQTAYKNKYRELMENLQQALFEVSACEASVYDEPDWFNRYGFMYYQFMESRYAW